MNWIEFCRMNEAMEIMRPTGKINLIKKEWENITDKETFVKLLTLDLPPNNVQNKKAIKWLTKIYELFDDELDMEIHTYGDIGEAIYHFDQNDEDSSTGLVAAMGFLSLDCSKSDGTAYQTIREVLLEEGMLSKVVSEVAHGLSTPILERQNKTVRNSINEEKERKKTEQLYEKQRQERIRRLNESTGMTADVFNGTKEIPQENSYSPLAAASATDEGVDISAIEKLAAGKWKNLI